MGLILDEVSFEELASLLGIIEKRRVFFSACSVVNAALKDALKRYAPRSIVGPNHDVGFYDAAIFWASFYRLVFKANDDRMSNENIIEIIKKISPIFEVYITMFIKKEPE